MPNKNLTKKVTRDGADHTRAARKSVKTGRPVTLADVAQEAGVAVGTASRVLNNAANVKPDARLRVMEAVARLNYRRLRVRGGNRTLARRLAEHPRNIGLVLLGMDETLVHVPVLTEVLHGVDMAVTGINGNLLFANLPKGDRVPPFLKNGGVEGLIMKTSQYFALPHPDTNPLVKRILRLPLVWVWAKPDNVPGDVCSFDSDKVAVIAAKHLRDRGHTHVGFINPKLGKSSFERIKREFQFACQARSVQVTPIESSSERVAVWPEPALTGPGELIPLVDQWLAMPKAQRPTALFVPADNIAVQVNVAFRERGVQVGRDVSLISVNNEKSLIQMSSPMLTTIDINARDIGSRCVDQLLWRIAHPESLASQTILLEPHLVEGSSVVQL